MNQFYNPQGFQYQSAPRQQFPYTSQQGFQPLPPQGGIGGGAPLPPAGTPAPGAQIPGMLPIEQSYIENILRLNKGKLVTVYSTFENNREWNAKAFKGIIEAAGRDHVILSDPQTGIRYLIPMVAVDYITFEEPIEYEYPFGGTPPLSTQPPR